MYVYLDEWVWIRLAKASIEKGKQERVISDAVIKASESSDNVFPLSFSHLLETSRRQDPSSRRRLAQFMVAVSKGNTILPFTSIFKPEIRNAIFKLSKQLPIDLLPIVFGKGIPHILDAKPELIPSVINPRLLTLEQRKEIMEMIYSGEL